MTLQLEQIELTHQFEQTFDILETTNHNVFVTGKAGTGKSTLLHYFRQQTEKEIAVLAPTGVSALNVQGQTIHSFFGFDPDITQKRVENIDPDEKKMYRELDTLVIDEISMVRADLLDCIDKFLRIHVKNKPFGGLQLVFFGDLYQLPPVVNREEVEVFQERYDSPYFFSSDSVKDEKFNMKMVELNKIYRQQDQEFIEVLSKIRINRAGSKELELLNERYDPNFTPNSDEFFITLTTTNKLADKTNKKRLSELSGEDFCYEGRVKGDFSNRTLPTKEELVLKRGSQIMLLNNDQENRWVNGSVGEVIDIIPGGKFEEDVLIVELNRGQTVQVKPHTWRMYEYYYDEEEEEVKSKENGSFTQYPVRLAWAVTIHKGQGKTFDNVIIDFGNGAFAHGQAYVAFSRCTSLDNLILKNKIKKRDIITDSAVNRFFNRVK